MTKSLMFIVIIVIMFKISRILSAEHHGLTYFNLKEKLINTRYCMDASLLFNFGRQGSLNLLGLKRIARSSTLP